MNLSHTAAWSSHEIARHRRFWIRLALGPALVSVCGVAFAFIPHLRMVFVTALLVHFWAAVLWLPVCAFMIPLPGFGQSRSRQAALRVKWYLTFLILHLSIIFLVGLAAWIAEALLVTGS